MLAFHSADCTALFACLAVNCALASSPCEKFDNGIGSDRPRLSDEKFGVGSMMFVPRVKYEVPRVMSTSDQRSPCATRTPATAASARRRAAMMSGRDATADRVRLSRSSGPRNATGPAHALG